MIKSISIETKSGTKNETKNNRRIKAIEAITKTLFLVCALVSALTLFLIIFFIFSNGVPAILQVGFWDFVAGRTWAPTHGTTPQFGMLPMLYASAITTFFAFIFGTRIGKWCAIYLAFFCPKKIYKPLKTMVELLGGIPSVLYGFFGVAVILPLIRNNLGGTGNSLLAAVIILTMMILPTVINLSEAALRAVPEHFFEGALALGTTKTEAIFDIVTPSAKGGINGAYILGIGRAVGETMAVIMVAGNVSRMPNTIGDFFSTSTFLTPVRTLTAGIAMEMSYATGLHRDTLFGIGVVLFTIIVSLNLTLAIINRNQTNYAKES
ncbi:MAG: phosphate ABC transporter permease subunit PstC [Defluviitaleaceae bacterium]|nr:phosphate ABC transporter permease subunit PstC [Defluviitaleaceae bacterium]